jgi:methionyl-tRNA synthetase
MTESKRYTITAALYRMAPFICHLAGVRPSIFIPWVKRKRCFVCVQRRTWCCYFDETKKKDITRIDKYDGIIRKSFIDFDISFDNYSRTSAKFTDTASGFTTLYEKVIL